MPSRIWGANRAATATIVHEAEADQVQGGHGGPLVAGLARQDTSPPWHCSACRPIIEACGVNKGSKAAPRIGVCMPAPLPPPSCVAL